MVASGWSLSSPRGLGATAYLVNSPSRTLKTQQTSLIHLQVKMNVLIAGSRAVSHGCVSLAMRLRVRPSLHARSAPLATNRYRFSQTPRRVECTHSKPTEGKTCASAGAAQKQGSQLPLTSREFWSSRPTWRRAGVNTLRCLVGCTAGDFSAMWYLQAFHPDLGVGAIMALSSQ